MKFSFGLIILVLSSLLSVAQIDLYNGLLGCYSFNGNANDHSGKENHGVVSGAVLATDRFGNVNCAYNFDGYNDFISISPSTLKNDSYSYSVWAKMSAAPSTGNSGIVFSIGDAFDSKHQTINVSTVYASDGFVGWNVGGYNDGYPTTTSLQSGIMPTAGVWYHLAVTRDNSQMRMYINGVLAISGSTNGNPPYYGNRTKALLGLRCNYTQPFNGVIDDFVIYGRVLGDNEVQELYNSGVPCFETSVNDGGGGVSIGNTDFFIPNVITKNDDDKNEVFGLYYRMKEEYFLYEGSGIFYLKFLIGGGIRFLKQMTQRKGGVVNSNHREPIFI